MHTENPTLSVICVFRNRKEWVEPTLKALYSIKRIPTEFIFIDDASTDGTTEAIRSLIEYFQHDQTYFYEQEAVRGRGNSLNAALEQVRGRIFWIPENLHTVDQDWLSETIETLIASSSHAAIAMEDPVPKSPMDWLHLLQNERLPYDRNFLFDFGKMKSIRKFTDPHWSNRHASEWAIRLQADSDPIPAKLFARGETRKMEMDDRSRKECILALLRNPELSLSGQEKAFRMLRSYGHTDTEEDEGSSETLYQEAQALYKSGNSVVALEVLNRILAAEPDHRRARLFKIQILEKMRRYVEAAELKHGYNVGKDVEKKEAEEPVPDEETGEESGTDEHPGEEPDPDEETGEEVAPQERPSDEPDPDKHPVEEPDPDKHPVEEPAPQEQEEMISEDDSGDDSDAGIGDDSRADSGDEPAPGERAADERKPQAPPGVEDDEDVIRLDSDVSESHGERDRGFVETGAGSGKDAGSGTGFSSEDSEFYIDLGDEEKTETVDADDTPVEEPAGEPDSDDTSPDEDLEKTSQKSEPVQPLPASVFGDEIRRQPELTIIIPTATVQRPVLEDCLTSVFRHTSTERTRIIIIDNASVDDTPEFLANLARERPMVTVLRNEQNLGFAGAVNQGLAKAGDGMVIVMHNDVILKNPVPARLAHKLEKNPDIGLLAPRTGHTWNKAQRDDQTDDQPLTETDLVDGYLMAFRNQPGLTMNRDYGLAYFDDIDFCYRLQKKGFRIAIDNREHVTHLAGKTTGDLGLFRHSKYYWRNSALFYKEWDIEPRFPSDQTRTDPLRQFVVLGGIINPFFPEKHLLEYFESLFTSEQKTRVLQVEFPPDALKAMIRLMMASNQREVLRRLEEQLDSLPPDPLLYHDLISFYFDRTIYSRCKRYLGKLGNGNLPVEFGLLQLKIAIGEKDYAHAAVLLKEMMEQIPTHPEVLITAAQIHRKNGNREQAEKFTTLARTFDPSVRP